MVDVKKTACFLVVIIFLMQGVFAISADIKSSYPPGETVISKISGNILEPITADKVEFRRGHVLVPFDYDLQKIGGDYYLWFVTPENEMNYTLAIKNITTSISGKRVQITYESNFSVSGNLSEYWAKPGFVSTEKDFEIKVQLNSDYNKQIEIKLVKESNFTLKPGENTIKFSISGVNETKTLDVIVGKYTIPAYIKINKTTAKSHLNLTNISEIDIENLSEEEKEIINCFEYPGGEICADDEECSAKTITSASGPCCVGIDAVCKSKGSSSKAWIGYLLGAIVILAGVFLWVRYKKIKAEKNPIGKKIQLLERRMV